MDKDTGVNSELEHAETRCAGQENQKISKKESKRVLWWPQDVHCQL